MLLDLIHIVKELSKYLGKSYSYFKGVVQIFGKSYSYFDSVVQIHILKVHAREWIGPAATTYLLKVFTQQHIFWIDNVVSTFHHPYSWDVCTALIECVCSFHRFFHRNTSSILIRICWRTSDCKRWLELLTGLYCPLQTQMGTDIADRYSEWL